MMSAAIPPAAPDPSLETAVLFAPLQTQPTVLAMMTTESSDMPMSPQCAAHVAAASFGTYVVPPVPTWAAQPDEIKPMMASQHTIACFIGCLSLLSPTSVNRFARDREPMLAERAVRASDAMSESGQTNAFAAARSCA